MEHRLVQKMKERGKHFYKVATLFDKKNCRWDLGLFHLEQSLQLLTKSKLLERVGDFPKTHNPKEPMQLLIKVVPTCKRLVDSNWSCIDVLEDSYIASRYLGADYGEREFNECENFVRKMWKVVWNERVLKS